MNPVSLIVTAMAGISFYVSYTHLLIYFQRKQHPENLTFAILSSSIGLYTTFCAALYNATSVSQGAQWQRAQVITLAIVTAAFLWFTADYTKKVSKGWLYIFSGYFLLAALIQIADRSSMTWVTEQPLVKQIPLPFGWQITYYEVTPGWFTNIQTVVGLVAAVYVLWSVYRFYKDQHQREALPLILALGLFFIAAINDSAISSGLYSSIYIMEFAYIGLVLLMTQSLSSELVEAAATRDELDKERDLISRITETSPVGITVVNKQGQITFANTQAEKILGVTKDVITQLTYNAPEWHITTYDGDEYPDDELPLIQVTSTKQPVYDVRHAIQWPDGQRVLLSINGAPLFDETGEVDRVVFAIENVTDQVKIDAALRESETRFRTLVENIPVGVYRNTPGPKGQFLMVNPAFLEMFAFESEEEIQDFSVSDLYRDPREREAFSNHLLTKGKVKRHELRLKKKDGTPIWGAVTVGTVYGVDGKVAYFDGIIEDITERKRAELALKESEEKFRNIIESIPMGMHMYQLQDDERLVFIGANPAADEILGVDNSQYIGKTIEQAFPALTETEIPEKCRRAAALGEVWQKDQIQYQEGNIRGTYEVYAFQTSPGRMAAAFLDITERVRTENEVRRLKDFNEGILQNVTEGIAVQNADGYFTYVNPAAANMLGYELEELINQHWTRIIPPDQHSIVQAADERRTRGESDRYELELLRKNGERIPVLVSGSPRSDSKEFQGTMAVFTDISDLKKAEEALRFTQFAIDRTGDAAFWTKRDACFTYVNDAACRSLGYTREELLELKVHDINPDFPETVWKDHWREVKQRGSFTIESQHKTKEGTVFPVEITVNHMSFEGQEYNCTFARDITHRKQAEEQIQRQLQRLNTLRNIDLAITASLDLRVTLDVFIKQAIDKLEVDAGSVLLLDPNTLILEYATGRGFRTSALQNTRLHLGKGYAGRAALEHRMVHVPDLQDHNTDFLRSPKFASEGFKVYFGIPLMAKGQVKGVLEIFHRSELDPDPEWFDFLEALATQAAIAIDNAILFNNLQHSNFELTLGYDTTLEGWAKVLEFRKMDPEGHHQRVTDLTIKIARLLGISGNELVHVRRGALLHDVGKMALPDSLLLKEGSLTEAEWVLIRQHPTLGYQILLPIEYLRPAMDIPYCHHEKWDGTGYPRNLKGTQIPLAARVFAVVDVWDALTHKRIYRDAISEAEALNYIRSQARKHFDPKVVETFLELVS
jgi:PAS domain S-box-containing protein